jgi:4-amino-4-deoxychorismate lyase
MLRHRKLPEHRPFELLETIKLNHGGYFNLAYHEERIKWAYRELYDTKPDFYLEEVLPIDPPREGLYRVRLTYPGDPLPTVELIPYVFPNITSLRLIASDEVSYSHKYLDRLPLMTLKEKAKVQGDSDFILVIDGSLTDTSFSNVVLENKEGFFTPDKFLLPGTKREGLIAKKRVRERRIGPEDLRDYDRLYLINAIIDLEDNVSVPIDKIY